MTVRIRPERRGDEAAIADLITAAFEAAEHSSGTEAKIVEGLRAAGALTRSLVAERDGEIVGHAAFSAVTIDGSDHGWFGLGPVAVAPHCPQQGIGEALIREGLDDLRKHGANGCVVLGDPAYYTRFGFKADPRLTLPDVPAEYFQVLAFGLTVPAGAAAYHHAFSV